MSDEIRCGTCRWWEEGSGGFGECHANPPQLTADHSRLGYWPLVSRAQRCGKWAAMKKPPKNPEHATL